MPGGAPVAANESERVHLLHMLHILDTAPEERFDRLTRLARRLLDMPMALVTLVDTDRQWFKSRQGIDVTQTPRELSFCAHTILGDGILEVPDTREDSRFRHNALVTGEPYLRFYAGYPLLVQGEFKLGALCVADSRPRRLTDEDRALFKDLAGMAEQEIVALQMATTDHLTQLSNRRGFECLGDHVLSVCQRRGQPAVLLMIDLDGFKEINDRLGHAAGDTALRAFARVLRESLGAADIIARLGGDEFVVLLGDTASLEVAGIVERLDLGVKLHNALAQSQARLSYSVGAVAYDPALHADIDALLHAADEVMYVQKNRTREAGSRL